MDIKTELHEKCGAVKLNESETKQIQIMTDAISKNLFGDGKDGDRKSDTAMLHNNLKDAFLQVKVTNKCIDLTDAIKTQKEELVGRVDKGYFTTDRTGLTKLLYDNSTNTKAGLLTGGIYLDETKIRSEEFVKTIKTSVSDKLQPLLNIEIEKPSKSSSKSKAESGQYRVSDVMTPPPTPKNVNHQTHTSTRDSR